MKTEWNERTVRIAPGDVARIFIKSFRYGCDKIDVWCRYCECAICLEVVIGSVTVNEYGTISFTLENLPLGSVFLSVLVPSLGFLLDSIFLLRSESRVTSCHVVSRRSVEVSAGHASEQRAQPAEVRGEEIALQGQTRL